MLFPRAVPQEFRACVVKKKHKAKSLTKLYSFDLKNHVLKC